MIHCRILFSLFILIGCDDPVVVGRGAAGGTGSVEPTLPTPEVPAAVEGEQQHAESEPDAGAAEPALSYVDNDFVEVDVSNRDPFRGFATVFRQRVVSAVQRRVIMSSVAVDDMRLIAIISGVTQPRAMLQDATGVGHVVKIGDYIGRAEVLQTGGADSMPVTLNWRIARIRSGEVILTRADPTNPENPPLTRSLPLYEEGEDPLELRRRALEREQEQNEP